MAYRGRGLRFNSRIDQNLLDTIEAAARAYKGPYDISLESGYRPAVGRGGRGFHPKGEAIDFALYDPKTGVKVPWYQNPAGAGAYQQFANHWYGSLSPEQQKMARWGGYFGDPTQPGYGTRYGEQDWMHLDFGRSPEHGMLGGDWASGFRPEAVSALGLSGAGGLDTLVGSAGGDKVINQVAQATGYTPEQVKAAFLGSIAGTEAPAYNTLYGGGNFGEDYSQHPNRQIPIMSGPNKGDYSTAAGRYQFLKGTWDTEAAKLGLKDFSAASQDAAAWDLADTEYKRLTKGGSLIEALQSNDPARINAAANVLNKQWTSLPGGAEQAKAYGGGGKTFADIYRQNLGGGAGGGQAWKKGEQFGPPASAAPAKEPGWGQKIAKALAGAQIMPVASGQAGGSGIPAQPGAANVVAEARPVFDPATMQAQRDRLAQALARLNQNQLWGG